MLAIGLLTAVIVLLISGLHIYWALGGRWGSDVAVPSLAGGQRPVFRPTPLATVGVAVGLAGAAALVLANFVWPSSLVKLATWALAAVFVLRAVGEFRYVGFFKTIQDTPFARYDSVWFSPLCLGLGLLVALIAWRG